MNKEMISQEELEERVAILTRFRQLLKEQQKKFREYLVLLEKQQTVIENNDTESLQAYSEMGNQIIQNIHTLQRVKEPLKELYKFNKSKYGIKSSEESAIEELQINLDKLQKDVLAQNQINKNLLKQEMAKIKNSIKDASLAQLNPYMQRKNLYTSIPMIKKASFIDIQL